MPFKKILPFSLLVCLWVSSAVAVYCQPQTVYMRRFTDQEGLPNNLYRITIQDHNGLLWMGGSDGLARYDGYEFKTIRYSNVDTTSLSHKNISELYEDSKGRLWVGTLGGGTNLSDSLKSEFSRIEILRGDSIIQDNQILWEMCEDALGRFWLVSTEGLMILEDRGVYFRSVPVDSVLFEQQGCPGRTIDATTVFVDSKDRIWIGATDGVYVYDVLNNALMCPGDLVGLPERSIDAICTDRDGKYWVAASGPGPRLFCSGRNDLRFRTFDAIPISSQRGGVNMTFDLDNQLWVTEFGQELYAYDFRDSSLFVQSSKNSSFAVERFMRNPFVDHSGDVWIHNAGFLIYTYPKGFHNYVHPYLFHQSNTAVYCDDDLLWLAYREEGIVRVNMKTGETRHFSMTDPANYIPVNHISDFLRLENGNMIIVGFSVIAVMDPQDRIVAEHRISGTNRTVFQDSKGRIWIGGFAGMHLFSEREGIIKTYRMPRHIGDDRNLIQQIVEDHNGNLWFASDLNGLAKLNPETEEIVQFLPVRGDSTSLPSSSIDAIELDHNGNLWLAMDNALVKMDPDTYRMTSYDCSDGFNNDYFSSVTCDKDGVLWMGTLQGISSFNPETREVMNYTKNDGLLNRSYYSRSSSYSENGVLYFGGGSGVDYFVPGTLRKNPARPIMYLDNISIDNERQLISADSVCHHGLRLTHNNDLLQIDFAGLYYTAPQSVNYFYRMDGLRNDWTDIGKNHFTVFTDLKPGEYTFRAKAISPDGVWSDELTLPIEVTPPFVETLWFRLMAIIFLGGALFGYMKYRERRIEIKERQEAEISRKITELEKRALQAQMNPHFIYNCMNSIQQFMVVHDFEGAMKYLTRFSRILRAVLNMSALSRVALSDEIKLIEDYLELENMRFPNKFSYKINVSPELNIHTVEIPPFFIQPQVENAVRHGLLKKQGQGVLHVNIDKEGDYVKVCVEDNGIGREASIAARSGERRESKGLSIVKERLSHMHQSNGIHPFAVTDLYDDANNPKGTRVEVYLPLE